MRGWVDADGDVFVKLTLEVTSETVQFTVHLNIEGQFFIPENNK